MSTLAIKEKTVDKAQPNDLSGFISVQKLTRRYQTITDSKNYQILWLENGVKSIDIDYTVRESFPFSIIFLHPGKEVKLRFNCFHPRGWILKFSDIIFNQLYLNGFNIQHADIFLSTGEIPRIVLSPKIGERINSIAEMISEVMQSSIPNKILAADSLLKTLLVYCDSQCNLRVSALSNNHYLDIVSRFKHMVSQNLVNYHHVSDYAEMMHVSPKYLNKIVKEVMGVTAKSVISEQLLIRSCRDLRFSDLSIKEIALQLGFSEPEHFSNFFKKNIGCSPLAYRQQ
jgi:AraC family transcriptional regulator, transcriptional activator of pobA